MSEHINWAAMSPDERDICIAERVTGWAPYVCPNARLEVMTDKGSTVTHCLRCGFCVASHPVYSIVIEQRHITPRPRYSQNMDDAWKVVEHMTMPPRGHEEGLEGQNVRLARFSFWFDKERIWAMDAPDAAQAICIAALRICGYEVDC